MLIAVLIFFKEPRRAEGETTPSVRDVVRNFGTVIGNWRFVLFLAIFSGYWVVFWQQYLILPPFVHNFVDEHANTEWILITDPIIVITCTVALNALTRRMRSFTAIIIGSLITSISWIALALWHSVPGAYIAIAILAVGEITQSPRYYEYISRLAPPGQQGTYMGFAFLPIGIGSLIGGWFGGKLMHQFTEVTHQPAMIWWTVTGVGILTTALLWLYDRFLLPKGTSGTTPV